MGRRTGEGHRRLPWGLAWRVALGQIISWGVLYYAFTVVVGPMQAGTGWSRAFLNSGLSIGLLSWGLCAYPMGVWIHRRGARLLMTCAAGLGAFALVLMGAFPSPPLYLAAWALLGNAMAGALYEPAFAVVMSAFGADYRRGILLVTLVGGLASTVFIPAAQVAVDVLGWQGALIALGIVQAAIVVPLHGFGLPPNAASPSPTAGQPPTGSFRTGWAQTRREISDARFVALVLWFTAHAAAFTGLTFQLVPALQALQVSNGTILTTIAIIGPMQVLGRLVLTGSEREFSTLQVGCWAMASLIAATLLLMFLPTSKAALVLFAALYGAGNGIMTILRGTAVAELFPRDRYAELNGALSVPAMAAKAGAPLAFAWAWGAMGDPRGVFAGVLVLVALGTTGLAWAIHAARTTEVVPSSGVSPRPGRLAAG